MKKVLAIILSALTLCSFTACSAGNETLTAEEDFEVIDASKLPSKVDLRNFEGKNYVTPVKNQWYGDCWSFSLAGAAEISYLFENDMGVPAGEVNDKVNFSEKYISWYLFHGITQDDVVKGKVRASQAGEGFDLTEPDKKLKLSSYLIGGPFIHNSNFFGAGFGPVDESVTVKGEHPYAYDDSWEGEWTLPLNAEYRNAPAAGLIRSSIRLPNPASVSSDGKYEFNADGINAIKSELSQGHGVSIALCSSHPGFNSANRAAYYTGDAQPDHAVTVVGYDDDYPKENFTFINANSKNGEDGTPPENGALIIKNSWGLTDYDGNDPDDGYVYISYYDHSLMDPLSYVFEGKSKHENPNFDQYDLMMTNWYGSTDYDSETKMANVFDAEEDENLYRIAYAVGLPKTEVAYEIYKGIGDDDPSSGTLLEKGIHRHTREGFYSIDLKEEYALKKGEKYSVVLTVKHSSDDGSMTYTEFFPYSTEFYEGMTVHGVINKGESYLYTDGKWSDMSGMKDDLIDRAYSQCSDLLEQDKALPELKLKGKDSFAVDNYPIKAILSPAE